MAIILIVSHLRYTKPINITFSSLTTREGIRYTHRFMIAKTEIENKKQSVLQQIQQNLLDNKNLSIRGVAEICGVAHTSIFRGGAFANQKLGESLISQGFQAGALLEKGFNAQATWLVIEYFAYESKAKALGAKQLARSFGALGIYQIFEELSYPKPMFQPKKRDAIDYIEAGEKLEKLSNPMLRSILEQRLMEDAGANLHKLPQNSRQCILTVRAKELGYTDQQIGNGASLGRYVAKFIQPTGKQQHGRYPVNTYQISSHLDEVIGSFFR